MSTDLEGMPLHPGAVILDSAGVLLLPDPVALRAALGPFAIPPPTDEQCFHAFREVMAGLDRVMRGLASLDGFDYSIASLLFADAFGVPADVRAEAAASLTATYLAGHWVPAPGAISALEDLARAGYELAVVTNSDGSMADRLRVARVCSTDGGVGTAVRCIVDSAAVGIDKPDPAIFLMAVEALGVEPGDCVYVGDTTYFDVAGALNAGLQPIHLDPYGLCDDADHAHRASLRQLADELVILRARQ